MFCFVASGATASEPAQRIVSLDYCADQYVLQFAHPSRILALSPDAQKPFSYLRDKAGGVAQVRPLAEDVLLLGPDLVVRSYGGGPNAVVFFERADIPVLQVGYANDLDGVRRVVMAMADGLGVADRGVALVADMDRRLERVAAHGAGRPNAESVLYMTSGGATSGPGTLVHQMFLAAGLRNFQQQPGWRSLPLEELAYEQPDRIALAQFNTGTDAGRASAPNPWSTLRHPIAREQLRTRDTTRLDGAWTSCGAWFLVDAIEALGR